MAAKTLKTYRAPSMAEALAEVKRELGAEAVILHTRTYKAGGWMGLGSRQMVEITATADATGVQVRRPKVAAPSGAPTRHEVAPALRANVQMPTGARAASQPVMAGADGAIRDTARATSERVRRNPPARPSRIAREFPEIDPAPPPAKTHDLSHLTVRAPLAPVDATAAHTLEKELASIKKMMGQVLQVSRQAIVQAGRGHTGAPQSSPEAPLHLGAMPESLFALYLRLLEQGVAPDLADVIVGEVRDELTTGELADPDIVRQTMLRRLAHRLAVTPAPPRPGTMPDGRPLVLALVGPTGVGKTTTLAKLAAAYKLRHGKRIGLVSCDTYRIAAVEQLRTYANIIALPLKVAATPQEVRSAIEAFGDADAVLIDTPGRSQHDATRIGELHDLLAAATPHETHLVLSSTASEAVLERIGLRFAATNPQSVVFTKLDECVTLGPVLNVARRIGLPLSFITTGQEVPDDIERADADRLARLILDGVDAIRPAHAR
ncbi:MAG: flagellar biosynthesis protein FlhF [Phycisphaeraceae bacterium]|nr:flagellar biosynthesis protein FlhF [Phycisphaeraceae bacterium]